MNLEFLNKVDAKKLFVESDAWLLFKYSALSEVAGWSLLIYGILADQYQWPGHGYALAIGGSIHGTLFLIYIGILAATYSSLGWTHKRALVGFFVSALPYGTLVFEQWAAKKRDQATLQSYRRIIVRAVIADGNRLLGVQENNTTAWRLPGGYVEQGELAEQAIVRILYDLTGIAAAVGDLRWIYQPKTPKQNGGLELYLDIANRGDFKALDLQAITKTHGEIDEVRFVDPRHTPDLEPAFLRSGQLDSSTRRLWSGGSLKNDPETIF